MTVKIDDDLATVYVIQKMVKCPGCGPSEQGGHLKESNVYQISQEEFLEILGALLMAGDNELEEKLLLGLEPYNENQYVTHNTK